MSQTFTTNQLRDETRHLRPEVLDPRQPLHNEASAEEAELVEDLWNVWPYCWAEAGWCAAQDFAADRFHSFHEKRRKRQLQRHNEKLRALAGCNGEYCGLRLV